jgi:hypothetical protein
MKALLLFTCIVALALRLQASDRPLVTYVDSPKPFRGAQAFQDKESGLLFYVESDGRHVAAIDRDGKILWHRDPFVDAKLEAYRVEHPVIVEIGAPIDWMIEGRKGKFVRVNFNSSQCLLLEMKSGAAISMGQD